MAITGPRFVLRPAGIDLKAFRPDLIELPRCGDSGGPSQLKTQRLGYGGIGLQAVQGNHRPTATAIQLWYRVAGSWIWRQHRRRRVAHTTSLRHLLRKGSSRCFVGTSACGACADGKSVTWKALFQRVDTLAGTEEASATGSTSSRLKSRRVLAGDCHLADVTTYSAEFARARPGSKVGPPNVVGALRFHFTTDGPHEIGTKTSGLRLLTRIRRFLLAAIMNQCQRGWHGFAE
jgi:hypothetical protein